MAEPNVMYAPMFGASHKFQILDSVVELVAVKVVNDSADRNSAVVRFPDDPMLLAVSSINLDESITKGNRSRASEFATLADLAVATPPRPMHPAKAASANGLHTVRNRADATRCFVKRSAKRIAIALQSVAVGVAIATSIRRIITGFYLAFHKSKFSTRTDLVDEWAGEKTCGYSFIDQPGPATGTLVTG